MGELFTCMGEFIVEHVAVVEELLATGAFDFSRHPLPDQVGMPGLGVNLGIKNSQGRKVPDAMMN
jgi:hypothetical protein